MPWTQRRPRRGVSPKRAISRPRRRLSQLSNSLGEKPFLDGNRFTAGDRIMTTVLRSLDHTVVVAPDRRLAAYVER